MGLGKTSFESSMDRDIEMDPKWSQNHSVDITSAGTGQDP